MAGAKKTGAKKTGLLDGKNRQIMNNKGSFFVNKRAPNGEIVKQYNVTAVKRKGGGKIRSNKGVPRKIAPSAKTMKM